MIVSRVGGLEHGGEGGREKGQVSGLGGLEHGRRREDFSVTKPKHIV